MIEKRPSNERSTVEPLPSVEQWLVQLWSEIFRVENIDARSDFFALGGNSLTAIRLLSRVEAEYGADVLLAETLFENGQLGHLARSMEAALSEARDRSSGEPNVESL